MPNLTWSVDSTCMLSNPNTYQLNFFQFLKDPDVSIPLLFLVGKVIPAKVCVYDLVTNHYIAMDVDSGERRNGG